MKSKLGLAEIALTLFAAAHLAACGGGGSTTGTGGTTGSDSGTGGHGTGGTTATDGGTDVPKTDGGGATDGGAVDTNGDAGPGPCVIPTAVTPAGTAGLQAAGPAVAGTATRPQFDMATADLNYTMLKFLANSGSVASTFVSNGMTVSTTDGLVRDDWDPLTNGIGDVSTFTPMFTVSADGTGTHTTVQAAITAARLVPATTCARIYIQVRPGVYRGTAAIATKNSSDAVDHALQHRSRRVPHGDRLQQRQPDLAGTTPLGTSGSATFTNNSSGFQAKNLTFSNDYVETGSGNEQAVALLNQGDRSQFENVRALGNQDTLYVKTTNTGTIARAYFRDSYFEGDTDFIFGRGTTVFDHCEIHTKGNNKISGTATSAPSTEVSNKYGFLYVSSKFTADATVVAGSTYLARQWWEGSRPQAVGKMIVRNSTIGAHINPTMPWQPWVGRTILAPGPDGGTADGGADAGVAPVMLVSATLYTSADYYQLIRRRSLPGRALHR